jgi:hypothetical protein
MSFQSCIDEAVKGGELAAADGERLKQDFERLRDRKRHSSEATADAEAKRGLAELLKAESDHQRRKAKLGIRAIRRIDQDLKLHTNASGQVDVADAALSMLEHFGTARFASVEGRRRAIVGMAHAQMETFLHHFRRGAVLGDKGRWNRAQLDNVVRELFGQSTGDQAAAGLAKSWTETAEWLRKRFNSAGGAIGKLEDWGLPQGHDPRAVRNKGLTAWKADIKPMLDPSRMRHPLTGAAIDERELDGILDEIFDAITTDGWSRRDPTRTPAGRGALANQRAEHRFLVFRDADSWLTYQRDYGNADPFGTMMGHINMMAKDIAAMEVLGPNPSGTVEFLKQFIAKEGALAVNGQSKRFGGVTGNKAQNRANTYQDRIDAVWGSIRGTLETPVNGTWAAGFAGARSIITASVLGSAAVSSVSDLGTQAMARQFTGLGASGVLPDIVEAFKGSTRQELVAAGLILDAAENVLHQQARYVGTLGGPQWASYLADRVLTVSGLTPWTQAGRHAFGLAFMRTAAEQAGKPMSELPEAFSKTLKRYGITDHQWDLIRKAKLHTMGGRDGGSTQILRPVDIAERIDPKLAERYLEMIQTETEFAIPNTSHRSKTALLSQNQPGTFIGEVLRSFAQFKSFGAVFMLLHGARVHRQIAGGGGYGSTKGLVSGASYAGSLLISTTLLGGLANQLLSMASGRDPQDMTTPGFWGAALLRGGGLGIYGDFLFGDVNKYGGGFATTLAGPVVQRVNDFWNLTAGNAIQLASGEKTNFGRELVRFAKGNVPGSNIWYARLAFERTVFDQLQYLVDPEANKAFKRQQQTFARERGQEFYWKPGEMLPSRAPNIATAAGS